MARYVGADCKRCRREKVKLFLKGSKCDGPKCPIESRPYPPGQHGRGRASAEFGEKSVPAWLEVVPSQMRIIVHGAPTRAVIDTQVQEQLIVELYSK
ncbi:MAG: hypothetical protein EB029_01895 [Actinobacteria bacterium]|nr:hypothetical protein [Actinomycetota bacterium]